MSSKPKLTRSDDRRTGKSVPNERATMGAGISAKRYGKDRRSKPVGALQLGNSDMVSFTSEAYYKDVESGKPTVGRWTRVCDEVIKRFNCHRATAARAFRDAELIRYHDAELRRPTLQARTLEQLNRIADREEERQPLAAVAALREVSRITGLYAPKELKVTHGATVELELQLDAIIGILDDEGNAAMQVVLRQIEAAKESGRLALPAPVDAVDAEIVEPGGTN